MFAYVIYVIIFEAVRSQHSVNNVRTIELFPPITSDTGAKALTFSMQAATIGGGCLMETILTSPPGIAIADRIWKKVGGNLDENFIVPTLPPDSRSQLQRLNEKGPTGISERAAYNLFEQSNMNI